jgi:hypothetical protein
MTVDCNMTNEVISEADVIEEQSLMGGIAEGEREEMGVAILERVAAEHVGPSDSLAFWLTIDEAQWPISDGQDTWEYEQAQTAWQDFLKSGHSGTDWFRAMYSPLTDDED